MSDHATDFRGDVLAAIRAAVEEKIPGAVCVATGGNGHYTIDVVSEAFAGKGLVDSQRLVYRAINHLLAGATPPIHAVDTLTTRTPKS